MNPLISLSFYKGRAEAAVAISFDHESSAPYGTPTGIGTITKGVFFNFANNVMATRRDLSFYYGLGYAMRKGAQNIIPLLNRYKVPATWFCTGHVLLKNNFTRNGFRINQKLPYATPQAGFSNLVTWRRDKPTFYYEPYGDFKKHPFWYLGDQTETIKQAGGDIQCHTFSHPYVPLEPVENVKVDIEDWQDAAVKNGFAPAEIMSFPFSGDAYRHYHKLGLKSMIGNDIAGQEYDVINLSKDAIGILRANGIGLITRCGSKYGMYGSIALYNDTNLHYMPDFNFVPTVTSLAVVHDVIEKAVENRAALNIWMHPSDVFTEEQVMNFERLLSYLNEQEQKGLTWIASIDDIWTRFKQMKQCRLTLTSSSTSRLRMTIENKNRESIGNVTVNTNGTIHPATPDRPDLQICGKKILIKDIPASGRLSIDMTATDK